MLRRFSVAAALWLLASVVPAHAIGLGDIKVDSALNQRFSAVVPFTSLSPAEAANVRARLGESQDFERAGLDRSAYLSTIKVDVVTDGPNPRIELHSRELAREPLLTLLIEVRTPGGTRMLREYTVLLDPVVSAHTPAPAIRTQPVPDASSEFFQTPQEAGIIAHRQDFADDTPAAAPRVRAAPVEGRYGPVRAGESLWMIAQAVRPQGVGLDQAMLALYETNPGAFLDGDIDRLRKGATLEVPDLERMQALSNVVARSRVLELSAQVPAAPAGPASSTPTEADEADSTALPAAMPSDPASAATQGGAPDSGGEPAGGTSRDGGATASVGPDGDATGGETTLEGTTGESPAAEGAAGLDLTPAPTDAEQAASAEAAAAEAATGDTAAAATEAPADEAATDGTEAAQAEPAPAANPASGTEGEQGTSISWAGKLLPFLIALILILVGFAVWRGMRERRAQREYEQASRDMTRPPSPRAGATGTIATKVAPSARDELDALNRQLDDDDATRIAATPDADEDPDRTRMVTTSKIPVYTGPQAAHSKMDEAEQAVTSQFQANTKQIDLGDNDPISEADFHLAYGLYDEAALMLQQASARAPQRTDLRVKLAETYFAAGKATEFEQTAATLKDEVGADEWSKIAIMGRQLLPAAALFADAGPTPVDTVLDLSFDDEVAPVKVDDGLEFNIEELELPSQGDPSAPVSDRGEGLEFDLGEFDLGGGKPKTPSAAPETVDLKDFDLGGSELSGPDSPELDVRLNEIEPMPIEDALDDGGSSPAGDAATKLDLARAYVEMGDSEMARSLLDEVAESGTDDQKREAGELRERLLS